MYPIVIRFLIPLTLLAFLFTPVAAQFQLRDVEMTPSIESLPTDTVMNLTAIVDIIPPGPTTTFVIFNSLYLSTELSEPQWNVIVFVNDRQLVVTPAEGAVVTVPGTLLSVDVKNNVSVHVTLDGYVPPSPDQKTFIVLKVEELNQRQEPVETPPQMVTRIAFPSTTPLQSPQSTSPTTLPTPAGLSFIPVLAAVMVTAAILARMRR